MRVWDIARGQELLTLERHKAGVTSAAFSPDGKYLASGNFDNLVRLWDAAGVRQLFALHGHTAQVEEVAFSPDGKYLASGAADGAVILWEAAGSQEVLTLKDEKAPVNSVAFSPDGKRLAAAATDLTFPPPLVNKKAGLEKPPEPDDGVVKVWDAVTSKEVFTLRRQQGAKWGMAFSPDGKRVASSSGSMIQLWDAASGKHLLSLEGHLGVNSVVFSPDGKHLVSGGLDNAVRAWDMVSNQEFLRLKHSGGVTSVAFSPSGKHLASGGNDHTVRLWDASSGQELFSLKGHKDPVNSVAFSPDGRRLASGSNDHTVRLWDTDSGRELLTLKGHLSAVLSVAFSPDGKRLASGGGDSTVRLWDVALGQEVLTFKGPGGRVTGLAFSPDGRSLAACVDGVVKVWETATAPEDLRRREIVALVRDRFDRLVLQAEVEASLRAGPILDATEQAFALQLVQTARQDPAEWNLDAWETVKTPGRDREMYALALRKAQAAVQAAPGNGNYLCTLGGAQYRLGEYAKALETLQRSEKLNATKDGSHPRDLAILAMAQHHLGRKEQAQETRRRLSDAWKNPRWWDSENNGVVSEAILLLVIKAGDPKK
jgi:WD40 repeat protein